MGNTAYRFLISFFTAFLWLMVFINYLGWSGAYINVLTSGQTNDWTNSYFGFESVSIMIRTLNESMNSFEFFSVSRFAEHGQDVLDAITGGLVKFITETANNGGTDILKILTFIVQILFQPAYFLATLVIFLGHILWYALQFVGIILLAFSGAFNVPFEDALTPPVVQGAYQVIQTII